MMLPNNQGNDETLQTKENNPAYILDIQNTGKQSIQLPSLGDAVMTGGLKKVAIFSLDQESTLARRVYHERVMEAGYKSLGIENNDYGLDHSLSHYMDMEDKLKQGGISAKDKYSKEFADIETSAWKEFSYKKKTLSSGLHQYIDKLTSSTGVDVANSHVANEGNEYAVDYRYGGNLCDISEGMLDFMQSHQEHQDIWNNVVKGTYSGFDDIVAAINKTGDTATGAELKKSVTEANGTKMTFSKTSGGDMWFMALGFENPDDV
jgi:hypothetical protein